MYRLILRMVGVEFFNNYRQRRRRRIKNERDTPLMFEDEEGHKIYAVYNVWYKNFLYQTCDDIIR